MRRTAAGKDESEARPRGRYNVGRPRVATAQGRVRKRVEACPLSFFQKLIRRRSIDGWKINTAGAARKSSHVTLVTRTNTTPATNTATAAASVKSPRSLREATAPAAPRR